ncbi:MAG TPA: sigma-54 dependent transcriptional regulator [Spirochaetia bacterium]|nr:sigma-54 dependent transcriptional regulator [Spirochaetia bacterium]
MSARPYPDFSVAVVDDEAQVLESVRALLHSFGITNVRCIPDPGSVTGELARHDVGVILLDLVMPPFRGEDLLASIRNEYPEIPVVVISAVGDLQRAVECMKAGAADYLTKPVEPSRLVATVKRLVEIQELRREKSAVERRLLSPVALRPAAFSAFVTADASMLKLLAYADAVAPTRHPVLVFGETGTGKELIARGIHAASGRGGEFVATNIAGLDDAMFSDALFGHRAGAYTGAISSAPGLVDRATNGTLFLDEIGDLSLASQVKLLRLLESGEYYPLGSNVTRISEARVIVATNTDLSEHVQSGRFRKDLYYRLKTHYVHVPPLRDRQDDLVPLVLHFVSEHARETERPAVRVPDTLFELLRSYRFPGNVRELRSMVIDALTLERSRDLSLEPFEKAIGHSRTAEPAQVADPERLPTIRESVDRLVAEALRAAGGNRRLAARTLGISVQALGQRLRKRTRH